LLEEHFGGTMMSTMDDTRRLMLAHQRGEITEYQAYRRLADLVKSPENRDVLRHIAEDERRHYESWKRYTQQDVSPNRLKVWGYTGVSRVFGLTFGLKWMERKEQGAQEKYRRLPAEIEEADDVLRDEGRHEAELLGLLDEERLRYVGSIVLGLNDALVELTGSLAGLTLAFQNTRLIALTGLIVGLAAALSMGASEYLSTKTEKTSKKPLRSAIYTGATYVVTVLLLVLPYLVMTNPYVCLALTMVAAMLIIAAFNYYISVTRDEPFRKLFLEMAGVSLGVAGISFVIGYILRVTLGVDA
jgi:VIT1/CCC1 family predicted Fe2+/Mn2+ transporter